MSDEKEQAINKLIRLETELAKYKKDLKNTPKTAVLQFYLLTASVSQIEEDIAEQKSLLK